MKAWQRISLEVLTVILLVPQVFVYLYYFRLLFTGGNRLGLLKALFLYGATVSWVSAPFLALLALLSHVLLQVRVRWTWTFLFCMAAGYLWVAAWNLFVFDMFSYVWAALPVVLCSAGYAVYAAARALYHESLLPSKPFVKAEGAGVERAKSLASDLSE